MVLPQKGLRAIGQTREVSTNSKLRAACVGRHSFTYTQKLLQKMKNKFVHWVEPPLRYGFCLFRKGLDANLMLLLKLHPH